MRKWTVSQLERIESDMELIRSIIKQDHAEGVGTGHMLDCPADCDWLRERIEIRAMHGMSSMNYCDGCPDIGKTPTVAIVSEYHDSMGAPSTLGVSYVCGYHVQYN